MSRMTTIDVYQLMCTGTRFHKQVVKGKGKGTHTHSQTYGPGADPGLWAVSLQAIACMVMNPVVGCHHLPPGPQRHTHAYHEPGSRLPLLGPQLPSQPSGVTGFRQVPTYTAW